MIRGLYYLLGAHICRHLGRHRVRGDGCGCPRHDWCRRCGNSTPGDAL